MDDKRKRLMAAVQRRESLQKDVQRIQGRLDSARTEVGRIEEECRSKGIAPDKLDDTIEQLEGRYEQVVTELEESISRVEEQIEPFRGEAKT